LTTAYPNTPAEMVVAVIPSQNKNLVPLASSITSCSWVRSVLYATRNYYQYFEFIL
jgi:hypothetical protein